MSQPSRAQMLSDSLTCLQAAAAAAGASYDAALTSAAAMRSELTEAEHQVTNPALYTACVHVGTHERLHYAETLEELLFSHTSSAMSVARVWYRAALAYASGAAGVLTSLHELGTAPERVLIDLTEPVPAPDTDIVLVAMHCDAACAAQAVARGAQPYGSAPWATAAKAWDTYAQACHERITARLQTSAQTAAR